MSKTDPEVWEELGDLLKTGPLFEQALKAVDACDVETLSKIIQDIKSIKLASERMIAQEVRDYIVDSSGYFTVGDITHHLTLTTKKDRALVRVTVHRLVEKGVLEQYGKRHDQYRKIDAEALPMDLKNLKYKELSLEFPLDISQYFKCYSKNIIVVAGAKDSGKTAFFMDFVKKNMGRYDVHYFNSEMGPEEMRMRLDMHKGMKIDDWKFHAYERNAYFSDVIKPDSVNIIDYLEVNRDFSEAGDQIKAIHEKLRKGIALIGLQKKFGEPLGRGGDFTLQRPRLYITMEWRPTWTVGTAVCISAKCPRDPFIKLAGKYCKYQLKAGWEIKVDQEWRVLSEDPFRHRDMEQRRF